MSSDGYYQRHVFFCLNDRVGDAGCCARQSARTGLERCRQRLREAALDGPGGVRANAAGCFDRCAGAPVVVVYPDAVWYTFVDESDIDEIVDSHLKSGRIVERLLLPPELGR
jgi:(2Fe-2S) ferredoxin